MNKLFIIGNLASDPETRETKSGSVTSFTVAVNKRTKEPKADFFRVSAWRQLGELCKQYLAKGRKVAIVGAVSVSAYLDSNGAARARLEVTADDVEFLSPKQEAQEAKQESKPKGFVEVDEDEGLPF